MKNVMLIGALLASPLVFSHSSNDTSISFNSVDIVRAESVQCEGKTKAGARCKRKVKNDTYCYQHIDQKPKK